MKKHTAKDAVKIIIATAKDYNRLLENKNFIFIYRNRLNNQIEYFETVFLPRHFQHLCGVDYINSDNGKVIHNSTDFYKRALNNELSHKEIKLREDGTTNYCLGFSKEGKYYMPSSCLLEDIRNLGDHPSQILAVLSKNNNASEQVYSEIRYVAKGVPLNKIKMPNNLNQMINLSKYKEK